MGRTNFPGLALYLSPHDVSKNGKIVESIAVSLVGIFIAILLLISVVNYKEHRERPKTDQTPGRLKHVGSLNSNFVCLRPPKETL